MPIFKNTLTEYDDTHRNMKSRCQNILKSDMS